jgi:hypothetical protein
VAASAPGWGTQRASRMMRPCTCAVRAATRTNFVPQAALPSPSKCSAPSGSKRVGRSSPVVRSRRRSPGFALKRGAMTELAAPGLGHGTRTDDLSSNEAVSPQALRYRSSVTRLSAGSGLVYRGTQSCRSARSGSGNEYVGMAWRLRHRDQRNARELPPNSGQVLLPELSDRLGEFLDGLTHDVGDRQQRFDTAGYLTDGRE